ncbi:hypothetical protein MXB_5701, partial [Myxobolus squamalis]
KPAYIYLLKENHKHYLILFKNNPNLDFFDIRKYMKEKNKNIIVSTRITTRVAVKKIALTSSKMKNAPTHYVFSLEVSIISSKFQAERTNWFFVSVDDIKVF